MWHDRLQIFTCFCCFKVKTLETGCVIPGCCLYFYFQPLLFIYTKEVLLFCFNYIYMKQNIFPGIFNSLRKLLKQPKTLTYYIYCLVFLNLNISYIYIYIFIFINIYMYYIWIECLLYALLCFILIFL